MENLILLLATGLVLRQSTSKFKRYRIGHSGCSALLHTRGKTLHVRYTQEGDKIYFNEYATRGVRYGLICVNMKERLDLPQAENLLVQYINRVRKPMNIAFNVSMQVKNSGGMVTITDYWQDEMGMDWKVKGYTNGKAVSVLYVRNINDTSVKNHDAFLDGFQFSSSL